MTQQDLLEALTAAQTAIAAPSLLNQATAVNTTAQGSEGDITVTLTVNGEQRTLTIEPRVTLLDALRDRLGLVGSKKGCDHGQCGACTVLIDDQRVYSCLALAVMQEDKAIVTIEGLAQGDTLHPVQAAFIDNDGLQCGYCTPGQICASVALLDEVKRGCVSVVTPDLAHPPQLAELSEAEIQERLSGNLCRCSAYRDSARKPTTFRGGMNCMVLQVPSPSSFLTGNIPLNSLAGDIASSGHKI